MKVKNIPCKLFTNESQDGLIKCRVVIMNEGKNRNGSSFSKESMIDAEESLKNRPLVAYIKRDDNGDAVDFGSHEIITKLIKTSEGYDLKFFYLETPIGIFPESCNIRYEEINGENHMVADAYIWEGYCNEALDLLYDNDGSKDVSMEISLIDSEFNEEGILDIKKFRFNAVTLLGDDVIQGMNGNCNISVFSKTDYDEFVNDISNKIYSLEKEGNDLENEVKVDVEETVEENQVEVTEIEEQFEETQDNETLEDFKKDEKDDKEEDEEFKCGGSNDKKKKKYEELEAEFSALQESYSELKAQLDSMSDYAELKAFKESYDNAKYESEIEEISNMFSLDVEEYADLKEKVLSREISKEQYQEKLALKQFMKEKHEKVEKKFEKEIVSSEIQIINDVTDKKARPYGGAFDKFLNK